MRRTLNQGAIEVEKLVFDPVEGRTGMRAAVTISKQLTVAQHDKTLHLLPVMQDRKSTRSRIGQLLEAANKRHFSHF